MSVCALPVRHREWWTGALRSFPDLPKKGAAHVAGSNSRLAHTGGGRGQPQLGQEPALVRRVSRLICRTRRREFRRRIGIDGCMSRGTGLVASVASMASRTITRPLLPRVFPQRKHVLCSLVIHYPYLPPPSCLIMERPMSPPFIVRAEYVLRPTLLPGAVQRCGETHRTHFGG